jgi:branched-chain amino acid transport system permease protein
LGLNIVVGYAGLLDLGYVAFFAVGAYSVALLTARSSSMVGATVFDLADSSLTNFWVALPITILVAVVIGLLIGAPVLRLRGDYLAIVTLGFGEIIGDLILSDWLKPIFGGPQGITEVDDVPAFGADTNDPRVLYYLIIAFAFVAYFIATRLKDSRVGRAWAAMREDEDIAEGMGVSVIKYKLLAFAMGAAVGCLASFLPGQAGRCQPRLVHPARLDQRPGGGGARRVGLDPRGRGGFGDPGRFARTAAGVWRVSNPHLRRHPDRDHDLEA